MSKFDPGTQVFNSGDNRRYTVLASTDDGYVWVRRDNNQPTTMADAALYHLFQVGDLVRFKDRGTVVYRIIGIFKNSLWIVRNDSSLPYTTESSHVTAA